MGCPIGSILHESQFARVLSVVILVTCIVAVTAVSHGYANDLRDSESYLQQTIVTLHKARNSVVERHYLAGQDDVLAAQENEDLLIFMAYLDGRIHHYCRTLFLNSGPDSLAGLPCPTSPDGSLQERVFDSVPDFSGHTRGEEVARLDQELKTALGEFDDMLLKEQERVAAHIPRQRESGGSGYNAQNDDTSGLDDGRSPGRAAEEHASADPETQKPGSNAGGGRSSEGAGSGRPGDSRLPPSEGPEDLSEADDDIVARQLREAAEQETDPEVKEKLWEEYRKYREGIK